MHEGKKGRGDWWENGGLKGLEIKEMRVRACKTLRSHVYAGMFDLDNVLGDKIQRISSRMGD